MSKKYICLCRFEDVTWTLSAFFLDGTQLYATKLNQRMERQNKVISLNRFDDVTLESA